MIRFLCSDGGGVADQRRPHPGLWPRVTLQPGSAPTGVTAPGAAGTFSAMLATPPPRSSRRRERVALRGAAPAAAHAAAAGRADRRAASPRRAPTSSGLTVDEAAARLQEVHGARLENGIVTRPGRRHHVDAQDRRRGRRSSTSCRAPSARSTPGATPRGAPVDVPLVVTYTKDAGPEASPRAIDKRLYRPARDSALRISLRKVRVTHSKARARHQPARARQAHRRGARRTRTSTRVIKPKLLRGQAEGDGRQAAPQRVDGHHDRAEERSSCACSST